MVGSGRTENANAILVLVHESGDVLHKKLKYNENSWTIRKGLIMTPEARPIVCLKPTV